MVRAAFLAFLPSLPAPAPLSPVYFPACKDLSEVPAPGKGFGAGEVQALPTWHHTRQPTSQTNKQQLAEQPNELKEPLFLEVGRRFIGGHALPPCPPPLPQPDYRRSLETY